MGYMYVNVKDIVCKVWRKLNYNVECYILKMIL